MQFMTKDQLLAATGRRFSHLEIPGFGTVRIGSLSAAQMLEYRQLERRKSEGADVERDIMLFLVAAAVVDGNGRKILDNESAAGVLENISLEAAHQLVNAVAEITQGEKKPGTENPSEASPSAS